MMCGTAFRTQQPRLWKFCHIRRSGTKEFGQGDVTAGKHTSNPVCAPSSHECYGDLSPVERLPTGVSSNNLRLADHTDNSPSSNSHPHGGGPRGTTATLCVCTRSGTPCARHCVGNRCQVARPSSPDRIHDRRRSTYACAAVPLGGHDAAAREP